MRKVTVAVIAALSVHAASEAYAADPRVVVTIKPVHALVTRVMDGIGSPHLLVGGTASPHTFSLKPSDARAINDADVFFRVAADVEPFTSKIMKSLPKSVRAATLADAAGVVHLARRTGEDFEAHGDKKHGKHSHGHDHDEDSRDGHVWLDPANAKAMTAAIAAKLTEAFPAHKERIAANASALTADLDKLASELEGELAPLRGKPFVVFHDAYQYFEKRFGVEAVGAITVSPEAQPSAKRLSAIRARLTKLGAACVYAEPQFPTRLIDAVTEGTKAKGGMLDPEGTTIEPGPDAYHQLLRGLARGLKACLAPAS